MMKLPRLDDPAAYKGLYIFHHGDSVSVGFTAAEIGLLLDGESHRGGKVYRIHDVRPDGALELRGVHADRWQLEMGLFFVGRDRERAVADFRELERLADRVPPPSRAKLQRGRLPGANFPEVVALIYPAEYDEEWSRWLLDRDYRGGELAEGGISHVADWYANGQIAERLQLRGTLDRSDRTREELVEAAKRPVARLRLAV